MEDGSSNCRNMSVKHRSAVFFLKFISSLLLSRPYLILEFVDKPVRVTHQEPTDILATNPLPILQFTYYPLKEEFPPLQPTTLSKKEKTIKGTRKVHITKNFKELTTYF